MLAGLLAATSGPACLYDPVGNSGGDGASTGSSGTAATGTSSAAPTSSTAEETGTTSTGTTTTAPIEVTSATSIGATDASTTGVTGPTSTGVDEPPGAATLQLTFSQIKQFDFSWSAAPGALSYQLLERPAGANDYAQIGGDILETSVSATMPLHLRFGARYVVRACNDGGCTDSAPVDVVDSLAAAVGYFKASNPDAGDQFAASVALSADGGTLAVGAVLEDSAAIGVDGVANDDSASSAGGVYVFVRSGEGWAQQAYVKASNTEEGDQFGTSVALSADGTTLAVSALYEASAATGVGGNQDDDSAYASGAVYVYTRADDTWSQQAYLKASNTGFNDCFGTSVALAADGDTLAVGAFYEDSAATGVGGDQANNGAPESGAVYVFARSNTVWSQQAYIKASNTAGNDHFGASVALAADGDTLAVGAYSEASTAVGVGGDQADNGAPAAGAVYVFVRANKLWAQQAYIKASNTDTNDLFGYSVALAADGATLAVGAYGEASKTAVDPNDDSLPDAGAAYVFVRMNAVWSQQAYLKAADPGQTDRFGVSVALSADGDTLAVGAPYEDSAAAGVGGVRADESLPEAGAAYMFVRSNQAWSQRAYVKAANPGGGDTFAISLAMAADGQTLALGASLEDGGIAGIDGNQNDNAAPDAGAVYLF